MVVKPLPNNSTSKNSSGGSGGPLILLHLATPEWYRMMPWKFLQLFWTGFSLRRHVVIPEWSISIEYIWIWISIQQTCLNTSIIFDNLCKSLYTSPTKSSRARVILECTFLTLKGGESAAMTQKAIPRAAWPQSVPRPSRPPLMGVPQCVMNSVAKLLRLVE